MKDSQAAQSDRLNQLAVEAHRKGEIKDAANLYKQAIQLHRDNASANHNLGVLLVNLGQIESALPFLLVGIEKSPQTKQHWDTYIDAIKNHSVQDPLGSIATLQNLLVLLNDDALIKHIEQRLSQNSYLTVPQDTKQEIMFLYNQGHFVPLQHKLDKLLKTHDSDFFVLNMKGLVLTSLELHEESIFFFQKCLEINPNSTAASVNLGNALYRLEKWDEAILAYQSALKSNPTVAVAYSNLGTALQHKGLHQQAIAAHKKAISIDKESTTAHNNLGSSLKESGQIFDAIRSFHQAHLFDESHPAPLINLHTIYGQLELCKPLASINFKPLYSHAKFHIQNAIFSFRDGDFLEAEEHLEKYGSTDLKLFSKLSVKDQTFCKGYEGFIKKLIKTEYPITGSKNPVIYHLGDSHCLTFSHQLVRFGEQTYSIKPKICFGVKAFHLAQAGDNPFKAFVKYHLENMPDRSRVLVSIGEIDCRQEEGIPSLLLKNHDLRIDSVVLETVAGYIEFLTSINTGKNHRLYLFNIPAPILNLAYTAEQNKTTSEVIKKFNEILSFKTKEYGLNLVDVFTNTITAEGFSNNRFHIDSRHLHPSIIEKLSFQD